MAQPSPVSDPDQADRIADVLLALETAPAVGFMLLATTVHDAAGATGVIMLRLGDQTFRLSPDDARMTADCIGFEDQRRATGLLVSLFHSAACDAEAMEARHGRPAGALEAVA